MQYPGRNEEVTRQYHVVTGSSQEVMRNQPGSKEAVNR